MILICTLYLCSTPSLKKFKYDRSLRYCKKNKIYILKVEAEDVRESLGLTISYKAAEETSHRNRSAKETIR